MTKPTERFTGRVAEYERYRQRYPMELLRVLRERCGLSEAHRVADVGAGTGMLAELFLENGNRVAAIEPNAEMRAVCEGLMERYPALRLADATAEATGLEDASIDFVAVGRALHWFDLDLAMREFGRVLRPHGWVVLVALGRSQGDSEREVEFERILVEQGNDYRDVKRRYLVHEAVLGMLQSESLVREQMHGEQLLTLEEFLGQVQSYSAAPLPGDEKYAGMQQALHTYFERWCEGGVLKMGTTCFLTCGRIVKPPS